MARKEPGHFADRRARTVITPEGAALPLMRATRGARAAA